MNNNVSSFYNSIYYLPGLLGSDPLSSALSALSNMGATPAANGSNDSIIKHENPSYQVRLSAPAQLHAAFSAFNSTQDELKSPASVSPFSAASSSTSIVTATAAKSGGASGSYDVNVTQLAKAQALVTATYNDTNKTIVGTGRITIETGTYDAANNLFTSNGTTAKTITVDASTGSNGTLDSIASAINSANAGVKAEVESVSTGGYRLKITSSNTGTDNTLRISVSDSDSNNTDNSGLSTLAYNPTSTANAGKNLTESVAAQNAVLTVNSKSYTSQSNDVTTAIKDVTLKLAGTGLASVTVARDFKTFQASTQKFTDAYNSLLERTANLVQSATAPGAAVKSDKAREALSDMRKTLEQSSSGVGGERLTLGDIGITSKANGKLEIDNKTLEKAFGRNAEGAASLISSLSQKLSGIAAKISDKTLPAAAPQYVPAYQPKPLSVGVTAPQSLFDLGPSPAGMFSPGINYNGTGLYSFIHNL